MCARVLRPRVHETRMAADGLAPPRGLRNSPGPSPSAPIKRLKAPSRKKTWTRWLPTSATYTCNMTSVHGSQVSIVVGGQYKGERIWWSRTIVRERRIVVATDTARPGELEAAPHSHEQQGCMENLVPSHHHRTCRSSGHTAKSADKNK